MRLTHAAMMGLLLGSSLLVTACASTPPKSTPNPDRELLGSVPSASGHALLECVVGSDGRAATCLVKEEHPAGYGIGQEAIRRVQQNLGKASLEVAGTKFTVRVPVEATALAEPTNR